MPYPTYPAVNVPNVPTPRLEHYLDFWESERDAARSIQSPAWASTPYHAEWDINVPVPKPWFFRPGGQDFLTFAGVDVQSPELRAWSAGSGLATVGQPLGDDPMRFTNLQAGLEYVSAIWAQRAANAALATIGAVPIRVDGIVGAQTITALRLAQLLWWARMTGSPVPADTGQTMTGIVPMPFRSGAGIGLAQPFSHYLAGLTQVVDPSRPAASPPPVATPPDVTPPPDLPPPSSSSGGGLFLIAALGLGAFAYSRMR